MVPVFRATLFFHLTLNFLTFVMEIISLAKVIQYIMQMDGHFGLHHFSSKQECSHQKPEICVESCLNYFMEVLYHNIKIHLGYDFSLCFHHGLVH